jgi:PLP dependent protein
MIATRIAAILTRIQLARAKHAIPHPVRLVAVSKTKSVEEIREAYEAGQRHFGENYTEEI